MKNWEEKDTVRNPARTETLDESDNKATELQHFHKPTADFFNYRKAHFCDDATINLEQNSDSVL